MLIKSDPGRLPRRDHYQEGPGFLFVATQGGRPVEPRTSMSSATTVRTERGRFGSGLTAVRSPAHVAHGGLQPSDLVPLTGTPRW